MPSTTSTSQRAKIQAVQLSSGALLFSDRHGCKFILKPKTKPGGEPFSSVVLAGNRAPAPPAYMHVPPPEKLQDMFAASRSLQVVWGKACACAHTQCRLLIRANRLHELLADLGTTQYRMERHGVRPACRAGIHTTLYSLADILSLYVCSAGNQFDSYQSIRDSLEETIIGSIHRQYGPEIRWRDLPEILGGGSLCERLIKSGKLVPSIKTRRHTLFPLKSVEDIAGRLQQGWVPPQRRSVRKRRAR